ncbi:MAG: GntR family transcriptional regulator [Thermoplasmata archaeon]
MQIYDQIVEAIASGKLNSGTSLPSARKLAADLGINFHTVNKLTHHCLILFPCISMLVFFLILGC